MSDFESLPNMVTGHAVLSSLLSSDHDDDDDDGGGEDDDGRLGLRLVRW